MTTTDIIQLLLIGLSQGCGYALVAIGFVFIYRATEVVNFAHGEIMMLGAFLVLTFAELWGLGFWLGAALGLLSMAMIGFLLDMLVIRRMIGESQASIFILTVAIGLLIKATTGMIWGYSPRIMNSPFQGQAVLGGVAIGNDRIAIVVGTLLVCALLWAFFSKTKVGLAMQAASQNQLAAYYSRVPVRRLVSLIWAIAAVAATLAGILMAPITQIDTEMSSFGIKAIAGAVVGGFGSIPGALIGCLIIGVSEPFLDYAYPPLKGVYAYVLLLAVLFIRPEGLIPQTYQKKV
jgi:branched-chain amino acid transport system permease protein